MIWAKNAMPLSIEEDTEAVKHIILQRKTAELGALFLDFSHSSKRSVLSRISLPNFPNA